MELGFKGERVLITGSTKGIGYACAETFAAEGCSIVITGRDAATVEAARKKLAGTYQVAVEGFAGDLSQPAERERLAAQAKDIDILVNNAGAIPGGGLLDLSMQTWEQAWALKVMGYIHLSQIYLGRMKEKGSGVIVNIIGGGGRSPRYDYACGGTGNAALMAFTGAIGGRSVDWGVRVFGINPSSTKTDRAVTLAKARAKTKYGDESRWQEMEQHAPLGRLAEPGEMARTAVFLASPACGYVSGATLDVDAGSAYRGGAV
ncbi:MULTISPECIES: short-chain dehydrogenase/reductase [unclassified Beijerinckia]|uniref:short-chain dehydrogenase/reductase n=1 Tax=unclassified Beijerinckia TaxID=2638183 RepID=UPI00089D9B35|nr:MULTISPECIES: short-chain dehydrogenase/reductase [unclassified Beijerinckia]MDH7798730.1 3-oxoacyl-[acyl-carrier protein] reductase [Beijerinckia sp. GAS462]SED31119.1 NAD(P)-dependent dehydrogenase, short-chain alcohol dehydrogenase family [Beijerinckia sp. 28-YEA-48]